MTATTVEPATFVRPRPRRRSRFLVAFLAGLLAALALGTGALYAWDQEYEGRILPGVWVGGTDLSGLTPDEARGRLSAAYAYVDDGEVVLTAGDEVVTIPWAELGRRVD